jgi:hypothetical protein
VTPWPKDITIKRGDTKEIYFRVRERVWDEVTSTYVAGAYRDLTGWSVLAQIRTDADAADPVAEFDVNLGDQVATPGGVLLKLTPAQTAALTISTGGYDVQLTDPGGDVYTYIEGSVTVKKDYSRA